MDRDTLQASSTHGYTALVQVPSGYIGRKVIPLYTLPGLVVPPTLRGSLGEMGVTGEVEVTPMQAPLHGSLGVSLKGLYHTHLVSQTCSTGEKKSRWHKLNLSHNALNKLVKMLLWSLNLITSQSFSFLTFWRDSSKTKVIFFLVMSTIIHGNDYFYLIIHFSLSFSLAPWLQNYSASKLPQWSNLHKLCQQRGLAAEWGTTINNFKPFLYLGNTSTKNRNKQWPLSSTVLDCGRASGPATSSRHHSLMSHTSPQLQPQ